MITKLCDRCKRRIKADAMSCICGWNVDSPQAQKSNSPACADCGAPQAAAVRLKTSSGKIILKPLCLEHYTAWWTPEKIKEKFPRKTEPSA